MSYLAFGVGDNSPCSFTSFLSPAQVSFSLICVGDSMGGGGGKNEGKGGGGGVDTSNTFKCFLGKQFSWS